MTDPTENDTLGSLEIALREAVAEMMRAQRTKDEAYRACSAALNCVNDLQKRIDTRINALKSGPEMRETDWQRKTTYTAAKA